MALDPNIALGVVQPKFNTPFESLGQIQQLRAQQQEIELRKQQIAASKAEEELRRQKLGQEQSEQADKAKVAQIISQPGISLDDAEQQIAKNVPSQLGSFKAERQKHEETAAKIAKDLQDTQTSISAANKSGAEAQLAAQTFVSNDAQQVLSLPPEMHGPVLNLKLQSYDKAFPFASAHFDDIRQQVAKGANPTQLLQGLVKSSPQQQNADTTAANSAAEISLKNEQAAQAAKVTAGMSPEGLTAEQQAQRDNRNTLAAQGAQRIGIEQQRLGLEKQKAAEVNAPPDIAQSITTTASGRKYVDLGEFQTPKARQAAHDAALAAGIQPINKDVADGLRAADTARANMQAVLSQIQGKLPKDPTGRIVGGPTNKLKQYFQSDSDLAAFGSWRTAAIQAVQALAEKGMGLRLNRSEIDLMLQNDIPQITDTWATAQQRVKNVMTLLDNKESSALDKDRSGKATPAPPSGTIRARDDKGVLHEAPAGTPLPSGWKLEQ